MSDAKRPAIDPLVLAELIEAVPGRVRKRLEKEPTAASVWAWTEANGEWVIATGEETVKLQAIDGVIRSHDQLRCSCLLSPKCFHVLACANSLTTAAASFEKPAEPDAIQPALTTAAVDSETQPSDHSSGQPSAAIAPAQVAVTSEMKAAAQSTAHALGAILAVGAQSAGLLLQSGALRAGHQCRAAGLITLGLTMLRIAEGIQRLRSQENTADATQLCQDLSSALHVAQRVQSEASCPQWLVGQVRRTFEPVEVRRLDAVCAEPILTLSGYAGVCVYLQSATRGINRVFTINELRPGDSQLIDQAYRGGIELGTMSLEASKLSRSTLSVQNLTASSEGRLGKGKSSRWAVQKTETTATRFSEGRFALPLEQQLEQVFKATELPNDEREGGWDLIAFDAVVLGAIGASLMVAVEELSIQWQLRIAIDDPQLSYRDNLQLLARCPGLPMRCLGRVRLSMAGQLDLIALASPASQIKHSQESEVELPSFQFPESWQGLCNLGLDRLQRHYISHVKRWSDEVDLKAENENQVGLPDGLSALSRRLTSVAIGGKAAVPRMDSSTHRRDHSQLRSQYQTTASELVELLAAAASQQREFTAGTQRAATTQSLSKTYLACATYLDAARTEFQRANWLPT